MLDPVLHVVDHIGDGLHVEPGVLEPADGGRGEVERGVGVRDRVEGEDEAEAVPGCGPIRGEHSAANQSQLTWARHHDALRHARQLQPHALLHRGDEHGVLTNQR